jgi:son of sevenless-like protein
MEIQLDVYFRHSFFLTFRTFATADEVFLVLTGHYELSPPDGISIQKIDDWRERKLRPTQDRVLACLTTWLQDYKMLDKEPHIASRLQQFLSSIQEPPKATNVARSILETLSMLVSDP